MVSGEKAGEVWWLENVVGIAVATGEGRGGFLQVDVGVVFVELRGVGCGENVGERACR